MEKICTLRVNGPHILIKKNVMGHTPESITKTMNQITNNLLTDFFPGQPYVAKEITMGSYSVAQRYVIFEQPIPIETVHKLSHSFRITN